MEPKEKTPIEKAIDIFKTQTALAEAIGTSQSFVSQWVSGARPVSPKLSRKIEEVTGGAITRYDLRPDIFGDSAA